MVSYGTKPDSTDMFHDLKKKLIGEKDENGGYLKMPDDNLKGVVVARSLSYPSHGLVFLRIAGLLGAIATALAAYGAHIVFPDTQVSDTQKRIYLTGNVIHYLHALVILAVPITRNPFITGTIICLGMSLFCIPCYITALTGNFSVAVFAPYGGVCLILGWLSMIL